jgi:Na+/phosphate symporter
MTKQKSTPEYVTREILKEEISASEKRLTAKIGEQIGGVEKRLTATLDSKIESTSQSLKDYTNSRFTQLDTKLTKCFELMMQAFTNGNKGINKILSNHEERVAALEARGPQASRI